MEEIYTCTCNLVGYLTLVLIFGDPKRLVLVTLLTYYKLCTCIVITPVLFNYHVESYKAKERVISRLYLLCKYFYFYIYLHAGHDITISIVQTCVCQSCLYIQAWYWYYVITDLIFHYLAQINELETQTCIYSKMHPFIVCFSTIFLTSRRPKYMWERTINKSCFSWNNLFDFYEQIG